MFGLLMVFAVRLREIGLILAAVVCMTVMAGCGGDEDDSTPKSVGSAEVSWGMACPLDESLSLIAQVYDGSNTYLTYGGPWDCDSGSGILERVPAGSARKIVVFAEDQDGALRHRGQVQGIDIEMNQTTAIGDVTLYPFVTILKQPDMGASVAGGVELDWDYVVGAARYVVRIADDADFSSVIIEESVPGPPYEPEGLEASVTYNWKVFCVDVFANQGADSEVRQFVVAEPVATISYPTDGDTFYEFYEIVFSGQGSDDQEGALTDESLVWTSDIDGTIGYGEVGEIFGLSVGDHVITLTATNSIGQSGSDSITIHILPDE